MFQSTRPLCERDCLYHAIIRCRNFNPLAPYGARLRSSHTLHIRHIGFNPHTPCEVRLLSSVLCGWLHNFNPLTPYGVRRQEVPAFACRIEISIHSPHAGRDSLSTLRAIRQCNFNPHTPRGVRPTPGHHSPLIIYFNPLTPCGVRRSAS